MKYVRMIWKNAIRNKRRTILTILSISVCIFLLSTLRTVVTELYRDVGSTNSLRLIVRNAVSIFLPMPERYGQKIRQIPGVVAVSAGNWFGGIYTDQKDFFANFACEPAAFFQVFSEVKIPPDQAQAFINERRAAIAGRKIVQKFRWKLGDNITLDSPIYRRKLEFVLRGIFTGNENWESNFFFHREYLEEAMGRPGRVGHFWMRVDSPESVTRVAQAIDETFHNTDAETKTETEKAFLLSFISMWGNIKALVLWISIAVVFTILLVTANAMAMAVRERTREIAVLKALGFSRGKILILLIAESTLITFIGGLLGSVGARLLYRAVDMSRVSGGLFQAFRVTPETVFLGILIAFVIGIVSVMVPAYHAARLTVVEGLRHTG